MYFRSVENFYRNLNVDTKLEHEFAMGRYHSLSWLGILMKMVSSHTAKAEESPLRQKLCLELKDKRMIVLKDQIHLKSTVGHGTKYTPALIY